MIQKGNIFSIQPKRSLLVVLPRPKTLPAQRHAALTETLPKADHRTPNRTAHAQVPTPRRAPSAPQHAECKMTLIPPRVAASATKQLPNFLFAPLMNHHHRASHNHPHVIDLIARPIQLPHI